MIIALVVDATIIRVLLVPATMRLLGPVTWWAPRPLRRFYARYGIKEDSGEARRPPTLPARSASSGPTALRSAGPDPTAPRSAGPDPTALRSAGPDPTTPRSAGPDPTAPPKVAEPV